MTTRQRMSVGETRGPSRFGGGNCKKPGLPEERRVLPRNSSDKDEKRGHKEPPGLGAAPRGERSKTCCNHGQKEMQNYFSLFIN